VRKADEPRVAISPLLSVKEFSKLTSLPPSWIYDRVYQRNLPFDYVKIGKSIRIPSDSLREYLARQTVKN
jgi:excisionase family DNA binding protein